MRLMRVMALLAMLLVVGCGSDGGSPTGSGDPILVSGTVYKGAVDSAEVNIYSVGASGANTLIGGPFTTDANGAFSGEVPAGTSGWRLVVAEDGSYTDEATGAKVRIGTYMMGMIEIGSTNSAAVTPYTHAAAVNATARIAAGESVQTAFETAHAEMTDAFGFDPTTIEPELEGTPIGGPARGANEQTYASLIAGVCQLIEDDAALSPTFDAADPWDLAFALMEDMSDGVLNGQDVFGVPLMVDPDGFGGVSPVAFPVLDPAGIGALTDAAQVWANTNFPGLTIPDYDLGDFGTIEVEVGQYAVTGTVTLTGTGSGTFGSPFTPDFVSVVESGGIIGLGFSTANMIRTIGVGWSSALGVSSVLAQRDTTVWTGSGLPVPGVTLQLVSANHLKVIFEGTQLVHTESGSTLTLNGTLNIQPQ